MSYLVRPLAIIFDLDDTLILSDGTVEQTWKEACQTFSAQHPAIKPEQLYEKIREASIWYWSDPERHRMGRIAMDQTRRDLVRKALQSLGINDQQAANDLADRFSEKRYEMLELFPGALQLLEQVRKAGIRIGMLTNGEARMQRRKIAQFQLQPYFDVIQIEGEKGFGKPEPAAYHAILENLGTTPENTWIVGDNLEWEVIIPQQLGLTAIWHNYYGRDLPDASVKPDFIVTKISQLAGVLADTLK